MVRTRRTSGRTQEIENGTKRKRKEEVSKDIQDMKDVKESEDVENVDPKRIKATDKEGKKEKNDSDKLISDKPVNIYNSAKCLFRRSFLPDRIIGREKERNVITDFILKVIESHEPSALYVSGNPGTGKTALTNQILKSLSSKLEVLHLRILLIVEHLCRFCKLHDCE
jgi:cell division control protein 6